MSTDDDLGPLFEGDGDDQAGGSEGDPRHILAYAFAHRALPDFLFHDPMVALALLGRDDASDTLRDYWRFVRDRIDPEHDSPEPGPDAFLVRAFRLEEHLVALIRLPEPLQPVEAYFAAFAVQVDPDALDPDAPPQEHPPARYLTLEKTLPVLPGHPEAILCGWTAEGVHQNFGRGVTPDLDAFTNAVVEHLTARPGSS
jgi:hypothetical protein